MPKKVKARKNRKNMSNKEFKRKLEFADEEGQLYGRVIKEFGNAFFNVQCVDGKIRYSKARNRRMRVRVDNIIIVSLRDFEPKKGDIIYVYDNDEVKQLENLGLLDTLKQQQKEDIDNEFDMIFDDI